MKPTRIHLLAALCAVSFMATVEAQTPRSASRDSIAMRTVARLLQQDYLTEQDLNNDISREALKSFLETLDPLKYYFDQRDIDEFARRQDDLDDLLHDGDALFAHRVFHRYLERLRQRVASAEKWIHAEHDFSVEEWLVTEPEHTTHAAGPEEADDRWRKRIKYDLLNLLADESTEEEARERLEKRYRGYQRRMERIEPDEVVQMFISSVTRSFDPHSTYMGAHQLENFEIHMRLDYQGVGALLVEREGEILIERILPGGPAARDGVLKAGDQIIGVGQGEDTEIVDVIGMRLRDAVRLIRGKSGTKVQLSIIEAKGGAKRVVTCVRGKTVLKEEAAEAEVRERVGADGEAVRVGWITLPSFYGKAGGGSSADSRSATEDLRALLQDFNAQGVAVTVLDLRFNGGGYLNEAVDLAGLFIDTGPVVQVRGYDGQVRVLEDKDEGVAWRGPLVVLTSKLSASASEIVAGAIKDYGRGIVIGDEQSHGKGTVQRVLPLDPPGKPPQLGALKLTTQKFYRINGHSTQLRGIRSDIVLPSITNFVSKGEAEYANALPYDSIDPLNFTRYAGTPDSTIEQVGAASLARRGESDGFDALNRRIAAYRNFREQTRVPLQRAAFDKFRAALEEANQQEPDPEADDQANPDEVTYKREVTSIAADYADALGTGTIARTAGSGTQPKKG